MFYINQNDYPHIPYPHPEGVYTDIEPTIATSGCGLCCVCMIVNNFTDNSISIEDVISLSIESGANVCKGTRMKVLLDYVAPKFGLCCEQTNDQDAFMAHLRNGGMAILRAGGDTEQGVGLFSHVPHSIVALPWDGNDVCILDPGLKPGKFDEKGRQGKVRIEDNFVYCTMDDLLKDTQGGTAPYALFSRK